MEALDAGASGGEIARKYQLSPKLLERWRSKWRAHERVYANLKRIRGVRGERLQTGRRELVERDFVGHASVVRPRPQLSQETAVSGCSCNLEHSYAGSLECWKSPERPTTSGGALVLRLWAAFEVCRALEPEFSIFWRSGSTALRNEARDQEVCTPYDCQFRLGLLKLA
jgi:transposase-like protein